MNYHSSDEDVMMDSEPPGYPTTRFRASSDQERHIKQLTKKLEKTYEDICTETQKIPDALPGVDLDQSIIQKTVDKCEGIISILQDTEKKRIFIGSTSQGKSTFINAFLKRKVLPSGLGSTTSQIVQVKGHDKRTYMVSKSVHLTGSKRSSAPIIQEFKDANSMVEYVYSLNKKDRDTVNSIEIKVPLAVFPMLRGNVVLIDSPGMGYEDVYNEAVSKQSKTIRTVVLVCNLETDITQLDMANLKKLCSGNSPAVCFIVMNKWDRALAEISSTAEREELRTQQLERCVKFLADEMNVDPEEASDKVFFLSGKAVLSGEPEATEKFNNFFQLLQLKEEEALCLKNIPEHKKSIEETVRELNDLIDKAVEMYTTETNDVKQKINYNDVIDKAQTHAKETAQLKVITALHNTVTEYEDKMNGIELATEEQAKTMLQDFVDDLEKTVDDHVTLEISKLATAVKEALQKELTGAARANLLALYEQFEDPVFQSLLSVETERYLDIIQWSSFRVTQTFESGMAELQRNVSHLQDSFRAKGIADEAVQETKEAKAAYAVATQKVMAEITDEIRAEMKQRRRQRRWRKRACWLTWCCGCCWCCKCCYCSDCCEPCCESVRRWKVCMGCGCGSDQAYREEEEEAKLEMSNRASKRIIERSKKIQRDLKTSRNQDGTVEEHIPLVEIPEAVIAERKSESVKTEYREKIQKAKKMAPEITQAVILKADPVISETVEQLIEAANTALDKALQEKVGTLHSILQELVQISSNMESIQREAAVLFEESWS